MELKSTFPYNNTTDLPQLAWMERVSARVSTALRIMRSVARWLFELGIQPDMPFYMKKNLSLINRVAFVSLLMALPVSFLLLFTGFTHPFSLMVVGVLVLCGILALNVARQVQWAQAVFAFSPAAIILTYTLVELSSGNLSDTLLYILARQGLCLTLLLPIFIFGFEKSQRLMTLAECVVVFLLFDVVSMRMGNPLLSSLDGMQSGFFSILSVLQLAGLSACVLYIQNYTLEHEHKVHQVNAKLQSIAIRDGMTGLFNHTFMEQLVGDAINRSRRSHSPLSLLMIDVDAFKQINDRLGHNTGDEVLSDLTKLLEGNKRSTDYLGRWGGDELLLLLTDTNLQGAVNLAEKLRKLVETHEFPHECQLTISLGASTYHDGEDLSSFIGRADAAMYRAKRGGRNRVGVQDKRSQ